MLINVMIMSCVFDERNVVILGKAGSGKKTLGNHIFGKTVFRSESIVGTRNVGYDFKEYTRENTNYRILTIDTEDLQTSYKNPLSLIQATFETIHLIIFVLANGRYTDESHRSLIQTVKFLRLDEAKLFSALVITHCEGITDKERQNLVYELKTDRRFSQIAAFIGKEPQTVGFPDLFKLTPQLKPLFEAEIARDEKAVRELVDSCKGTVKVITLLPPQMKRRPLKQRSLDSEHFPPQYYRKQAASQHLLGDLSTDDPQRREHPVSQSRTQYPLVDLSTDDARQTEHPVSQSRTQYPPVDLSTDDARQTEHPVSQSRTQYPLVDLSTDDARQRDLVPQSTQYLLVDPSTDGPRHREDLVSPSTKQHPLVDLITDDSQATTRTILILGTAKAGKKTLGNRIAGEDIFQSGRVVGTTASVTRHANGQFILGNTQYRIQIVQTDSLDSDYNYSLTLIQKLQTIHLIIFVVAYGCYTDESHSVLMNVLDNLTPNATSISALLFTHCEGFSANERQDLISSFRTESSTRRLAAFMGRGIHAVGFPDLSKVSSSLKLVFEEGAAKDQLVVEKLVKGCNIPVDVKNLRMKPLSEIKTSVPAIEGKTRCVSQ